MKRLPQVFLFLFASVASTSADPITLVNHGFEDGLNGWTTTGNVQALGPTSVLTYNGVEWAVSPSGGQMGALNSNGAQASALDGFFGLPNGTLQGLNSSAYGSGQSSGAGGLTNGSGIYQDFSGNAGDTVSFYFDFVARDYIPYNDPAFGVLVSAPGDFQAQVIGSVWAGGVEVGTAGNSGWRPVQFTLPETGNYRVGFGVTNERDEVLDSALFLDDAPGGSFTEDLEPGETPVFPVLPDSSPTPTQFGFVNPQPGLWYDPPFAEAYTYTLIGGDGFTGFQTPDAGFGFGDLTFTDGSGVNPGFTAVAGTDYTILPTPSFTLSGLPDGLIDFASPGFSVAFPVLLDWTGVATDLLIDVTPQAQQVPEPATFALLTFGVGVLAAARRRSSRSR